MNKKRDLLICASIPVATLLGLAFSDPEGALGQTALAVALALKPLLLAIWGLLAALAALLLPLLRLALIAVITIFVGAFVRANRKAVSPESGRSATLCGVASALCVMALSWGAVLPILVGGAVLAWFGYGERSKEYDRSLERGDHKFLWDVPMAALMILSMSGFNAMVKDRLNELDQMKVRNAVTASHRLPPAKAAALDKKMREMADEDVQFWTLDEGRTAAPASREPGRLTLRVPGVASTVGCRKDYDGSVKTSLHPDTTVKTDRYLRRLCEARASEY